MRYYFLFSWVTALIQLRRHFVVILQADSGTRTTFPNTLSFRLCYFGCILCKFGPLQTNVKKKCKIVLIRELSHVTIDDLEQMFDTNLREHNVTAGKTSVF